MASWEASPKGLSLLRMAVWACERPLSWIVRTLENWLMSYSANAELA